MKYITDMHALNLPCSLGTVGDWHASGIQWTNLHIQESDDSPFGDWGIEAAICPIPENPNNKLPIANHIRALLDMIEKKRFSLAQGMRMDFIGDESFNDIVFEKVLLLRNSPNWPEIDNFMEHEYLMDWVRFRRDATGSEIEISFSDKNNASPRRQQMEECKNRTLDEESFSKLLAYTAEPTFNLLSNLVYIINNHWEALSPATQRQLSEAFYYKGVEYAEFLVYKQGIFNPSNLSYFCEEYLKALRILGYSDSEVDNAEIVLLSVVKEALENIRE